MVDVDVATGGKSTFGVGVGAKPWYRRRLRDELETDVFVPGLRRSSFRQGLNLAGWPPYWPSDYQNLR